MGLAVRIWDTFSVYTYPAPPREPRPQTWSLPTLREIQGGANAPGDTNSTPNSQPLPRPSLGETETPRGQWLSRGSNQGCLCLHDASLLFTVQGALSPTLGTSGSGDSGCSAPLCEDVLGRCCQLDFQSAWGDGLGLPPPPQTRLVTTGLRGSSRGRLLGPDRRACGTGALGGRCCVPRLRQGNETQKSKMACPRSCGRRRFEPGLPRRAVGKMQEWGRRGLNPPCLLSALL